MFSEKLNHIIHKDAYLKDWRYKAAICLFSIGLSELGIQAALTGNLDKRKDCINLCKVENVDFNKVWKILHA